MLIIGHRGAGGSFPENTLLSFEKAIKSGVEMIELDVHRSADGELVVMHDDKVNRTTDGKGWIRRLTFSQIHQLDAGNGEKIPLLEDVFALVQGRVKINIELKGKNTAGLVAQHIREYRKKYHLPSETVCVSSFDHRQLFRFRENDHETRIGILYNGRPIKYVQKARLLQAFSVNLSLRATKPSRIQKIHAQGLQVWVYTVNTVADLEQMRTWGVDAVFTDFPERLLHHLSIRNSE